ncbi:S9 family peptidase [Aquimarina agarilytica]|uniref:S9 family peptidase n=1 Tax=Aquimarina agarilytica TaxID=1087449 RepID=UPI0002886A20|nr:S9 family peptidase [Aquimarina agarilytica]
MLKLRLFVLILSSIFFNAHSQKQLTLEAIWGGKFRAEYLEEIHHLKNGKEYSTLTFDRANNETKIEAYNYLNPTQHHTLLSSETLEISDFDSYEFSPNETKVLLGTKIKRRYRYSSSGIFYVYDFQAKTLKAISDNAIISPVFSPDGNKIAYVFNNNLFIKHLASGKLIQVTTDGKKNTIINGLSDWVYEEEFELVTAFAWNSTSDQLAYFKFDESKVPQYSMMLYKNDNYPETETFKYPKAGETNSQLSAHVYNSITTKTAKIDLSNFESYYLPRLQWTNDPTQLCIQTLNRHQNKFSILSVNTKNKKVKTLYTETDKAYVDITNNLTFLKDNSFLLTSEKESYNHIFHYNNKGKLIQQVTNGNWDVTHFYGIDRTEKRIFYQSTENNNIERQIFSVNKKGTNKKQLTSSNGVHNADFSADYSLFIDTFSNTTTPYQFSVVNTTDSKKSISLKNNKKLSTTVTDYHFTKKEFNTISLNGEDLNSWILKPKDFDASKKYPVLLFQYSGPGSQMVKNSWNSYNDLWHHLLTQKGYIVACIDGRGTGFKGGKFKKSTQLQLGKLEAQDQIDFAKHLAKQPYVDASRIGIWGWSFGGFTALNAILKGNTIFKTAISVAPVTHWKYYDTIYTERFLTTPQENSSGYNDNSPLSHADKLKGNLLLVHGSADDNVHLQNTLQMASELTKANKAFDMAIYPDKNHGIYGGNTRLHLYTKMTNFLLEHL